MPRDFQLDPNLEVRLTRSYKPALVKAAEAAVLNAKLLAPKRTGAYAKGIKVKQVRGKVYVAATDFKSHWIEWGSVNNTPSAPVRRGVRAAGLKFREDLRAKAE